MLDCHASFEHKPVEMVTPLLSKRQEADRGALKIVYFVLNLLLVFIPLLVDFIIASSNVSSVKARIREVKHEIESFLGLQQRFASALQQEEERVYLEKPFLRGNLHIPELSEEKC